MILIRQGQPDERFVPCGRCHECVSARINSWVFRLKEMQKVSKNNLFLTLTYDDDNMPTVAVHDTIIDSDDNIIHTCNIKPCFDKQHIKDFIRSIRDKIRYEGKKQCLSKEEVKALNSKFKYFLVSEFGSLTDRPHYHALLFNLPNLNLDWYEVISEMWSFGFVHFGNVSDASIIYTAGYLFKNYDFRKEIPEERKVFMLCSNGIGADFITPSMLDYLKNNVSDKFEVDGHRVKLPRYILEKVYPKLVCSLLSEKNLEENLKRIEEGISKYGLNEYYRINKSLNEMKRKRFIKKKTKQKI